MSQQGFALHTTTGELGLALVNHQGLYRYQSWDLGRQLANEIQLKLAEFITPLSWQDLDFIAVAKGPGSYTSTRIGVVTARILAQQLNIPVYGISTLEAIAWYHRKQLNPGDYIAVEMKAHNEEIFGAIYQYRQEKLVLITVVSDQRITRSKWQLRVEKYQTKSHNLTLIKSPEQIAFTTESLLDIALVKNQNPQTKTNSHWQKLIPFYE